MYLLYAAAICLLVISGAAGQNSPTTTNATTSLPASTSTAATSESTAAPSSSTAAPNTSTTAPNSSTTAPVSTSTASATTTTLAPQITGVRYVVKISSTVCIALNATINFTLPYQTPSGIATISYSLPNGGSTDGSSCHYNWSSTIGQLLSVTFPGQLETEDNWKFELFFENSSNSFAASKLRLAYTVQNGTLFPNAAGTQKVVASFDGSFQNALFTSSINGYYSCNSASTTKLSSTLSNETSASVHISNLSAFAFGTQNSTYPAGTKTQCPADVPATPTDYLVPIIVGCALAGIIIIVLVAYIIGRYRSRNTYQTV